MVKPKSANNVVNQKLLKKELSAVEKRLDAKIDKLDAKIDTVEQRLETKIEVTEQSMKDYIHSKTVQVQTSINQLGEKLDVSVKGIVEMIERSIGKQAYIEEQVEDHEKRITVLEAKV